MKTHTLIYIVATNISFNCGMEFPAAYEQIVALLAFINVDQVLPSLGLSCAIGKFDYIDKMFSITLAPLILGFIIYFVYRVLACFKSTKMGVSREVIKEVFNKIDEDAKENHIETPFTKAEKVN